MVLVATLLMPMAGCVGATQAPSASGAGTSAERPSLTRQVPGEVLVQFQPDTSDNRKQEILNRSGIHAMESLGMPQAYLLKFPGDIPVEEMIRRLKDFPEVRHAEPNRLTPLKPVPAPR
jgi:hypothetical protein